MARARKALTTVDDLTLDDRNANRGTARGRELLAESLKAHGAGRPILTDRFGVVIAGNKTLEAWKTLKKPVQIIRTNGHALVVHQRDDLDLRHANTRALAIADNRIAEVDLEWNPEILKALQAEGLDLNLFWTEQEWAVLTGTTLSTDPREDQVLEPGPTTIRRGDFFALGAHRLLCGDATNRGDVTRLLAGANVHLIVTDPPYGVRYRPGWRHRAYPHQRTAVGEVMGDDQASWPAAFRLFPGTVAYAWHAGTRSADAATALETAGFEIRAQLIWNKSHFVLSRGNYHFGHEPCFYAVRRGASARGRGDRSQSTVWNVPNLNPVGGTRTNENIPTGHSTQKPVRLWEIPMLNHTVRGEALYDPFVGSGTALIAAEKTGRVAYVMDADPKYVQVALTRWETYTGRRAKPLSRGPRRRA